MNGYDETSLGRASSKRGQYRRIHPWRDGARILNAARSVHLPICALFACRLRRERSRTLTNGTLPTLGTFPRTDRAAASSETAPGRPVVAGLVPLRHIPAGFVLLTDPQRNARRKRIFRIAETDTSRRGAPRTSGAVSVGPCAVAVPRTGGADRATAVLGLGQSGRACACVRGWTGCVGEGIRHDQHDKRRVSARQRCARVSERMVATGAEAPAWRAGWIARSLALRVARAT